MTPGAVVEAVNELEKLGARLVLAGGNIRITYRCPAALVPALQRAVALLRSHKNEAIGCLRARITVQALREPKWSAESFGAERKFGHPAARLYPFLNQRVRTPRGMGRLLQVFKDRADVLLEAELAKPRSDQRASFFDPTDVCPPGLM